MLRAVVWGAVALALWSSQGAQAQDVMCNAWFANTDGQTCTIPQEELNQWLNAPEYPCATASPPYSAAQAAAGARTRRNARSLATDTDKRRNLIMALQCSQNMDNTIAMAADTAWSYVATFHGAPGWFTACAENVQGNQPGTCCSHSHPLFVLWHRLVVLSYENAMRRWSTDADVAMPYWDWTEDETDIPSFYTDVTWTDPSDGTTYRNPWWNYDAPANVQLPQGRMCQYVCRDPAQSLFNASGLADYVRQAFMSTNWIEFDLVTGQGGIEAPHNDIHMETGGSLPNLYITGFDPLFSGHHSNVERQFLLWQQAVALFGAGYDYAQPGVIAARCGCGVQRFGLLNPIHPFASETTNGDPVGRALSSNGDTFKYADMHYAYEDLTLRGETVQDIYQLIKQHKTSEQAFVAFNAKPDEERNVVVKFNVTRASDQALVHQGELALLSAPDNQGTDGVALRRVPITASLAAAGMDVGSYDLAVSYEVLAQNGSAFPQPAAIVPHYPAFIYRSATGAETHRFAWGDDPAFDYSGYSFILNLDANFSRLAGTAVELVMSGAVLADLALAADASSTAGLAVDMTGASSTTTRYVSAAVGAELAEVGGSLVRLAFDETWVDDEVYGLAEQADTLFADGANRVHDVGGAAGSGLTVYADLRAYQGFAGEPLLGDANDGVDVDGDGVGYLRLPAGESFIGSSQLFNRSHAITTPLDMVAFNGCSGDDATMCLADTQQDFDACTPSAQCGTRFAVSGSGTDHFVARNASQCQRGMKLAVTSTEATSTVSAGCSQQTVSVTGSATATTQAYAVSLTVKTDCSASITFAGPDGEGWFAYGFWGPWATTGAAGPMQGIAFVAVKGETPALYFLYGPGVHRKISNAMLTGCTVTSASGVDTHTCQLTWGNDLFRFWAGHTTGIAAGTPYYLKYAAQQGFPDPKFRFQHNVGPENVQMTFTVVADEVDDATTAPPSGARALRAGAVATAVLLASIVA